MASWRPCWLTGTIRFSPLGVNFQFYANYVRKFSFVLSTNMAAMQTTYTCIAKLTKISNYRFNCFADFTHLFRLHLLINNLAAATLNSDQEKANMPFNLFQSSISCPIHTKAKTRLKAV